LATPLGGGLVRRYGSTTVLPSRSRAGAAARGEFAMKSMRILGAAAIVLAAGLSACTNPYDPGQRAVGGGLLGAGAGAATGALIGGAVGAVTGAATTPPPPPPAGYYPPAPGYYPSTPGYYPGSCWDPYYRRYYPC